MGVGGASREAEREICLREPDRATIIHGLVDAELPVVDHARDDSFVQ